MSRNFNTVPKVTYKIRYKTNAQVIYTKDTFLLSYDNFMIQYIHLGIMAVREMNRFLWTGRFGSPNGSGPLHNVLQYYEYITIYDIVYIT